MNLIVTNQNKKLEALRVLKNSARAYSEAHEILLYVTLKFTVKSVESYGSCGAAISYTHQDNIQIRTEESAVKVMQSIRFDSGIDPEYVKLTLFDDNIVKLEWSWQNLV